MKQTKTLGSGFPDYSKPIGDGVAQALQDYASAHRLTMENISLRQQLEIERMRLAACGVVAISDTPDSAKEARSMHSDYRSASCDDVARRVDECIALRQQLADQKEYYEHVMQDGGNRIKALSQQLSEKDAVISRLQFALADTEALELGTAERLAASQLREQQFRSLIDRSFNDHDPKWSDDAIAALAIPTDTSALESLIAKAGEVMRERCELITDRVPVRVGNNGIWGVEVFKEIRAIPGVKLEDLQNANILT